ncbi:flavodoxin family protein [Orenia marismortui]|uniref:flavodoxin family protein n=1 Tax=Orenia marismortui TaxID=46469 RepID=UPI00038105AC|nr:flavodoxin family protein [Orenia marismortui]
MKIAIVNGSTRKDGVTAKILGKISVILTQKNDLEVNYYDLIDYQIEYCTGCRVCYRTGKCSIISDEIEKLADKIKRADGIIMGSSTFGSYVTGRLKSFWDRGHFIVEQSLYNKYGFSVATYEIAEGNKALSSVKKFFLVSGAIRGGSILKRVKFNEAPFTNQKFILKLEKKIEKFYQIAKRRKRRSLFEFLFTKVILIPLIWKPRFLKRRDEYKGVLEIWKNKGII